MSSYQIIEASNVRELTTRVIGKMEAGWLPNGGLVIDHESQDRKFKQAITRIEEITDADYPVAGDK